MIHTTSQATGLPMLNLHGLTPVKVRDDDTAREMNDHAMLVTREFDGGSHDTSLDSTPRKSSTQQTPRTPLAMNHTHVVCISSPLRMVGKASPCSVKLKGSARLEGGFVVSNMPKTRADTQGYYPRELSFGNLLDNDGTDVKASGSNHVPRPIGLCPMQPPKKIEASSSVSLPLSPRKRSRKNAPIRSSVNAN